MEHAPLALQLAATQRESAEMLLAQIPRHDPLREDADPETQFHELFDRFHAAQFDHGVEFDTFLHEVTFNQREGIGPFVVKNILLSWNFTPLNPARFRPGVVRADDKAKFVSK